MANAVKSIAKFVEKNREDPAAGILTELCEALESGNSYELGRLYDLQPKAFEMAMDLLSEWRFDRHITERRFSKYISSKKAD
jgi:hypothetical protein